MSLLISLHPSFPEQAGGNAIDAAIAVAAALAVTEPCSTGLGGDCFILYYEAANRKVHSMNGSGRSPSVLSRERVLSDCFEEPVDEGAAEIPKTHAHTVTVPGAAAGWCDALARWGTMAPSEVLARSIELAEDGFPVSPVTAFLWAKAVPLLIGGGARSLLLEDEAAQGGLRAPLPGELFSNPALAATLRELAKGGTGAFYEGRVAAAIIESVRTRGGVLSSSDLQRHASEGSEFGAAVSAHYNGVDVYEHPPNGQGLAALIALSQLEMYRRDANKGGKEGDKEGGKEGGEPKQRETHNSAAYLHRLIETMRLAFADARYYVTDPAHEHVPVDELLSEEYARKRLKLFHPGRASVDAAHGSPVAGSDTVSFQAWP